jgi:DNA-binding LytR/AlgR family response regulator
MDKRVNIRVEIDPEYTTPQVIIRTGERNGLVENIINAIETSVNARVHRITVNDGEKTVLIDMSDSIRVYVENRKLIVSTVSKDYESRQPLKQFEKKLDPESFIRISRFEIVNINRVTGFDMSVAGTIAITLENGSQTYVARRCVRDVYEKILHISKGEQSNE